MKTVETCADALARIQSGRSDNDTFTIIAFADRGIELDDIKPRENVLTFKAWRAVGRQVAKGAISVSIPVWIKPGNSGPDAGDNAESPETKKPGRMFCRSVPVFHISQTIPAGSDERPAGIDNPALFRAE